MTEKKRISMEVSKEFLKKVDDFANKTNRSRTQTLVRGTEYYIELVEKNLTVVD